MDIMSVSFTNLSVINKNNGHKISFGNQNSTSPIPDIEDTVAFNDEKKTEKKTAHKKGIWAAIIGAITVAAAFVKRKISPKNLKPIVRKSVEFFKNIGRNIKNFFNKHTKSFNKKASQKRINESRNTERKPDDSWDQTRDLMILAAEDEINASRAARNNHFDEDIFAGSGHTSSGSGFWEKLGDFFSSAGDGAGEYMDDGFADFF